MSVQDTSMQGTGIRDTRTESTPVAEFRPGRGEERLVVALFAVASFISAGLLFLIEPMVGKLVLPLFGGVPSVWNTSMLFFQAALLGGYLYAHLSVRWLGLGRQPLVHLIALLLPLAVLPVGLPGWARPPVGIPPAFWLLWVLVVMVGAPFFVVSTTAPLLQRWFAATGHRRAGDPYFLYAAGNAGSLLALMAYPAVVEPRLSLAAQGWLWAGGYVLFLALVGACALVLLRRSRSLRAAGADVTSAPLAEAGSTGAAAVPGSEVAVPAAGEGLGLWRQLWWVGLAFVPSSLMLGVTAFISTDIAAFPLLWVVPLALYLLSFIVAFGQPRPKLALAAGRLMPGLVLAVALLTLGDVQLPIGLMVIVHLLAFTSVALVAHGRLAADRPEPAQLTHYYLLVSLGGVLGGVFNALVAPVAFQNVIEYPLVLAASLFVVVGWRRQQAAPEDPAAVDSLAPPAVRGPRRWFGPVGRMLPWTSGRRLSPRWRWVTRIVVTLAVIGVPLLLRRAASEIGAGRTVTPTILLLTGFAVVAVLAARRRPLAFAVGMTFVLASAILIVRPGNLATRRTFFGVQRVDWDGERNVLVHGSTIHGWQDRRPGHLTEPQNYFHPSGPMGQAFGTYTRRPQGDRVAVVGLGAGTLAAYGHPGQHITFYEIDQAMVDIASDPDLFSFLNDTSADYDVVVGDGRLTLADAPDHSFGVIVLDAFNSDAVPVHLLTNEAIQLYRQKLAPGGIMLFQIANRHVDLRPVLAGVAARQNLAGLVRYDEADENIHKYASAVVALAESPTDLAPLAANPGWDRLTDTDRLLVWTDDFSNILNVLSWR